MVLGAVGWDLWRKRSRWWTRHPRFEQSLWATFWLLNGVLLSGSIVYEAKRARVEAMTYLYEAGAGNFAMIRGTVAPCRPSSTAAPGTWSTLTIAVVERPPAEVAAGCPRRPNTCSSKAVSTWSKPCSYKADLPGLRYKTTIQSSRIDRWLERLNPLNSSERIIYAVEDALPCP